MYVGLLNFFFALLDILNTKDPNPGPAPVHHVRQMILLTLFAMMWLVTGADLL